MKSTKMTSTVSALPDTKYGKHNNFKLMQTITNHLYEFHYYIKITGKLKLSHLMRGGGFDVGCSSQNIFVAKSF